MECPSLTPSLFMLKPSIHAGFGIFCLCDCDRRSDVQTFKNQRINRRKTAFEPSCLFFFRCSSVIIQVFIGIGRSIPQRGMWTLHIIEIYVFSDTFLEFFHRMIMSPIQFLPFERSEKGFHNRIVTGLARGRKGLLHMERLE